MKKVVLFDVGHLLTDNERHTKKLNRLLKRIYPALDNDKAKVEWKKVKTRSHRGIITKKKAMEEFLKNMGLNDRQIYVYLRLRKKHNLNRRPIFPGVASVLETLKRRGYRLCIVSDSSSPPQKIREAIGPVSEFISDIYSSREFGKIKGEGLLKDVLEIEKPDRVWFVCHDDGEAEASRALGINTIKLKDGSEIEKILELIP